MPTSPSKPQTEQPFQLRLEIDPSIRRRAESLVAAICAQRSSPVPASTVAELMKGFIGAMLVRGAIRTDRCSG